MRIGSAYPSNPRKTSVGRATSATKTDIRSLMSVVNALGVCNRSFRRTTIHDDDRVWVETGLKDVGDQALMRGLATAFPIVRPGLFLSYCGRRTRPATKRLTDVPLPLSRLRPCARCKFAAVTYVLIACASLATAHMKPANSRAIAVQTTVVRFPRATSRRYRAVNRL